MSNPHPDPRLSLPPSTISPGSTTLKRFRSRCCKYAAARGLETLLLAREDQRNSRRDAHGHRRGPGLVAIGSAPFKLEHKESLHDGTPFHRLKVRLKPEIVLGLPISTRDPGGRVYVDQRTGTRSSAIGSS